LHQQPTGRFENQKNKFAGRGGRLCQVRGEFSSKIWLGIGWFGRKKREPLPMPEGAQILLQLSLLKSAVQNYFFLVLFAAFFVAFLAVFFAAFLVVFFAAFFVAFFAVLAATITYLLVGEPSPPAVFRPTDHFNRSRFSPAQLLRHHRQQLTMDFIHQCYHRKKN
jgi:hypothetical protein